ncbi:glucose-6-phosphatase 3 [Denticeps clupeoides]|nr:glucose-6-phosphatase 3 [Denticeps clupeoides]
MAERSFMDALHTQGLRAAEALQLATGSHHDLWLFASHLGDPKAAFLLLFPLSFHLSRRVGLAVVWAAALSEWLNLVLKWVLFGERPFWWIGESRLFVKAPPQVQQFPSTCETGPGSPSGHMMVTAAVWWVVTSSLTSHLYSRTNSKLFAGVPLLLYALVLVAVGLSRIFLLAHFPHQVVGGFLAGLVLGVLLNRTELESRSLLFFLATSAALFAGALLFYSGLQQVGVDPSWSIALARRWCTRSEWVRMDTTPFSSLMRDCGALIGLGLAKVWRPRGWSFSWAPKALCLALSSMALYHINRFALPVSPPVLFYTLFLIKFSIVPQVVMFLIPGLVHLLTARPKKE